MKIHKLRKKDFCDLTSMYKRLNCVHDERHVFSYCTYVSPKTYKDMEKEITGQYKKKYDYLKKNSINASVSMYMFNLGPSVLKGLPDNVILVDEAFVKVNKELAEASKKSRRSREALKEIGE